MNDEEALVRALVEEPDDEVLLSVFFDWLEENGAEGGVVRFHAAPPRHEGQSHLFLYSGSQVVVSALSGAPRLWRSFPSPGLIPEAARNDAPLWERNAAQRCAPIENWETVRRLAEATPSCWAAQVPDDTRYHLELREREWRLTRIWHCPNAYEHAAQKALIRACQSLIVLADLRPKYVPAQTRAETDLAFLANLAHETREEERQEKIARRLEHENRRSQRKARERQ